MFFLVNCEDSVYDDVEYPSGYTTLFSGGVYSALSMVVSSVRGLNVIKVCSSGKTSFIKRNKSLSERSFSSNMIFFKGGPCRIFCTRINPHARASFEVDSYQFNLRALRCNRSARILLYYTLSEMEFKEINT